MRAAVACSSCFLKHPEPGPQGGRSPQEAPWSLSPQHSFRELAARPVGKRAWIPAQRGCSIDGDGKWQKGTWPLGPSKHSADQARALELVLCPRALPSCPKDPRCQNRFACGSGTRTEMGMVPKGVGSERRAGHPGPRPERGASVHPKKCCPLSRQHLCGPRAQCLVHLLSWTSVRLLS